MQLPPRVYYSRMGTFRDAVDGAGGPFDEGRSLWPAESRSEPPPWSGPEAKSRPWEDWSKRGTAAGLADDLVALGVELIRVSVLQGWPEELRARCGHYDDGEAMIDLALSDPELATRRWDELLQADGDP